MRKIKKNYIILCIIGVLLLGFISGIIYSLVIDSNEMSLIKDEYNNFFSLINTKEFNYKSGLLNSIINNTLTISIIWLSGILLIFLPITSFILFYKSFSIGLLFSSLISIFKIKGIYYFVVFIFPHLIINLGVLFILTSICVKMSIKFFKTLKNNELICIRSYFKRYIYILLILLGIGIVSSFLEIFLNTFLVSILI